jgi:hypothetical protein
MVKFLAYNNTIKIKRDRNKAKSAQAKNPTGIFREKLTVAEPNNIFLPFMQPENSLLYSKEQATGLYPESHKSIHEKIYKQIKLGEYLPQLNLKRAPFYLLFRKREY